MSPLSVILEGNRAACRGKQGAITKGRAASQTGSDKGQKHEFWGSECASTRAHTRAIPELTLWPYGVRKLWGRMSRDVTNRWMSKLSLDFPLPRTKLIPLPIFHLN